MFNKIFALFILVSLVLLSPIGSVASRKSLTFFVATTVEEGNFFQNQLIQFEKERPDIETRLIFMLYSSFYIKLLTLIAAGDPPDVAVLSYNNIAMFKPDLQPLMELVQNFKLDIEDFLEDALDSNTFDGELYGLPWLRSACLPRYRNLALFKASKNTEEAFELMVFLTQPEQQLQNFEELRWFPTRKSVYDELGIECPDIRAIRLTPEQGFVTISLVEKRWPNLKPVLEGQTINYSEAVAVIDDKTYVTVAPVMMEPISEEKFKKALLEGVILGVVFVDKAIEYPQYPPGNYVVKCKADPEAPLEEVKCYLVNKEKKEIEIKLEVRPTKGPVGQPFCLVMGSPCICLPIDNVKIGECKDDD